MAKTRSKRPKSFPMLARSYEQETPARFLNANPSWSFCRMDTGHPRWSIKSCGSLYESVIIKLKDFEGLTWQEIMSASGGRSAGTNSHFEDVADLCKEARDRIASLHMEDTDRIFSLRLTARERLYGILEQGIFFVLWYDANHEIYPVSK